MELELYTMEAEEQMNIAIDKYTSNLSKISAGRANPQILNSIKVDYFGTLMNINELASILVPEPKQLLIKPFDASITKAIVNVINSASLGVRAIDEGDKARINFPTLTTERRRQLVKSLSQYNEQAQVAIRHVRQEINKGIKHDDELSEDEQRLYLDSIQKITDKFSNNVKEIAKSKEKELMSMN